MFSYKLCAILTLYSASSLFTRFLLPRVEALVVVLVVAFEPVPLLFRPSFFAGCFVTLLLGDLPLDTARVSELPV